MGKLKYKDLEQDYPEMHGYFCFLTKEEIENANLEIYQKLAKACDYVAAAKLIHHIEEAIECDFIMKKRARISLEARGGDKDAKIKLQMIQSAEEGENPFPWRPLKTPEFGALMREYAYIILELRRIRTNIEEK